MPSDSPSLYARRALQKQSAGAPLTANEQRRVARLDPLRTNYRPLGVSPAQLADRIHLIQGADIGGGQGQNSGTIYTFTSSVSGIAKKFDIQIVRGPY